METDWLESMKSDLEKAVKPKDSPDKVNESLNNSINGKANMEKKNDWFFIGTAILLIFLIFITYKNKEGSQFGPSTNIDQETPWQQESVPQNRKETVEEQVVKLKEFSTKILEVTKGNIDKITLLGILQNNNSCVIKNNLPKSDLIFINSDWTIDKMPTAINLDDEDKNFLKQYVKK